MQRQQEIDYGKPTVVYKNNGCFLGYLSVLFAIPSAMGFISLLFPQIAMFSRGTNLALTLGSAALWALCIWLGGRQRDSDEPVVIVSDEGIRWCRDTVFSGPWFVRWEDFIKASVQTQTRGEDYVEVLEKNPDKSAKPKRHSIGLVDTRCSARGLVEVIYGYYCRHRSPESPASGKPGQTEA